MSISLFRIVQFGSQVLHNGSTHFAAAFVENAGKAKLDIIELPNGSLFDPNGSNQAVVVPQGFSSPHVIKMTSAAAAANELAAIKALVGTRAMLVAEPYDGGLGQTCTARLEQVEATQKLLQPSSVLRFKLHFVPLEDWS